MKNLDTHLSLFVVTQEVIGEVNAALPNVISAMKPSRKEPGAYHPMSGTWARAAFII